MDISVYQLHEIPAHTVFYTYHVYKNGEIHLTNASKEELVNFTQSLAISSSVLITARNCLAHLNKNGYVIETAHNKDKYKEAVKLVKEQNQKISDRFRADLADQLNLNLKQMYLLEAFICKQFDCSLISETFTDEAYEVMYTFNSMNEAGEKK